MPVPAKIMFFSPCYNHLTFEDPEAPRSETIWPKHTASGPPGVTSTGAPALLLRLQDQGLLSSQAGLPLLKQSGGGKAPMGRAFDELALWENGRGCWVELKCCAVSKFHLPSGSQPGTLSQFNTPPGTLYLVAQNQ